MRRFFDLRARVRPARYRSIFPGFLLMVGLMAADPAAAQASDTTPAEADLTAAPAATNEQDESSGSDSTNVGRWYRVELIVFSRRNESGAAEDWPRFPDLSRVSDARPFWQPPDRIGALRSPMPAGSPEPTESTPLSWPLIDPTTGFERPYVVLPRPMLELEEEAAAIDRSRERSVILHTGWNMPVQSETNADYFRLHGDLGSSPQHRSYLDGTLRIYVGRYLHVSTQLYATDYELAREPLRLFFGDEPAPALNPERPSGKKRYGPWRPELRWPGNADNLQPQWVPTRSVRFSGNRRMRSNQLHYIDHPRLGLVIRFTPYEPFDPSDATGPADTDDTDTSESGGVSDPDQDSGNN